MNESILNYGIIKRYFEWLLETIDFDDKVVLYETLLEHLFSIDFKWLKKIPLDENRYVDGMELRKNYAKLLNENDKYDFENCMFNKKCSLLEMFVAFSMRLTQLVNLEKYEFFWMFIDNLGLGWATDYDFDVDIVNDILYDFIHGTVHKKEPVGNENPPVLFPCREVYLNMNYDLYSQANLYLKSYFL